MQASDFILSVLAALPSHEVKGKKRLQKFCYLLKEAGAPCDAEFILWDYGPFSSEVANSATLLSVLGRIETDEVPVGSSGVQVTVYRAGELDGALPLGAAHEELLTKLDKFTTLDLEIASTILMFERETHDRQEAIDRTKAMKPTKSQPAVIKRALDLLDEHFNQ